MAQPPLPHSYTAPGKPLVMVRALPTVERPLGIALCDCEPQLATDFYKELTNKLAWAIGSTYKHSYHSAKGPVRDFAWELTKRIAIMHGLPGHLKLK